MPFSQLKLHPELLRGIKDLGFQRPTPIQADAIPPALEGRDLAGMQVVVDCANGANSVAAPRLFERLGAKATVIAAAPDGLNINEACGSTHP